MMIEIIELVEDEHGGPDAEPVEQSTMYDAKFFAIDHDRICMLVNGEEGMREFPVDAQAGRAVAMKVVIA